VSDVIGLRSEVLSNGEGHVVQKKEKMKWNRKEMKSNFSETTSIYTDDVLWIFQWGRFCNYVEGLREEVKPCFAQSVSVFIAEVLGVFYYLDGFPVDVGMIGLDVDFRSVEVDTAFGLYKVFSCH
jgi:hypothetical protein